MSRSSSSKRNRQESPLARRRWLDRARGEPVVAGFAIDPAPTPGVPIYPHAIRSALPVFLDFLSWRRVKHMSRSFFRTRFAQTVPAEQADGADARPRLLEWRGEIGRQQFAHAIGRLADAAGGDPLGDWLLSGTEKNATDPGNL